MRRRVRTWLLVLLVLLGCAAYFGHRERRNRPRIAVVYLPDVMRSVSRDLGKRFVWRDLFSGQTRELGTIAQPMGLPDEHGVLPSPDGAWLLVWYRDQRRVRPSGALHWEAIRLSDGEAFQLGQSRSHAPLLPFWRDGRHLELQGDSATATFLTEREELVGSLPQAAALPPRPLRRDGAPVPSSSPSEAEEEAIEARYAAAVGRARDRARAAVVRYCRRHHPQEVAMLRAVLAGTRSPSDRRQPSGQPIEAALVGSIGIPSAGLLVAEHGGDVRFPVAGFSPDRRFAIRSTYLTVGPDREHPGFFRTDARLEVVSLPSGRIVWSTTRKSRRHYVAYTLTGLPGGAQDSPSLPIRQRYYWSMPQFGDLRWGRDGRYFSYTITDNSRRPRHEIRIVDASVWHEVARISGAQGGFLLPAP